jgi:hypothetical protein
VGRRRRQAPPVGSALEVGMAALAGHRAVGPREGEAVRAMSGDVDPGRAPRSRSVTGDAAPRHGSGPARREPAAVRVVVAIRAAGLRDREHEVRGPGPRGPAGSRKARAGGAVAGVAGDGGVAALERELELRVTRRGEGGGLEAPHGVAGVARAPVGALCQGRLAAVRVDVAARARVVKRAEEHAGGPDQVRPLARGEADVAGGAGDVRVPALERIAALPVLRHCVRGAIESVHAVARGAVRGPAGQGGAPGVRVPVAASAGRERRVLPPRLRGVVAGGARQRGVPAAKRIAGLVMIESALPDRGPPGRRVAGRAVRPEAPGVGIVVAGAAGGLEAQPGRGPVLLPDAPRHLALLVLRLVAAPALDRGVSSLQGVAGLPVVEPRGGALVPADHVEVDAGVVRVALGAGRRRARVETAVPLHQPRDLRVAREAFRGHGAGGRVALEAEREPVQVAVGRRERSRGHLGPCRAGRERRCQEGHGDSLKPPRPSRPSQARSPSRRCGLRPASGSRAAARLRCG